MAAMKLKIEPLISIDDVTELLGVKRPFVYQAIKTLGLPYYKINSRNIKFKLTEVHQWIQLRRATS